MYILVASEGIGIEGESRLKVWECLKTFPIFAKRDQDSTETTYSTPCYFLDDGLESMDGVGVDGRTVVHQDQMILDQEDRIE